ncbi:MAG: alpha/beta hydrolase, partial [Thermoanaerobaculia bacterium]
PTAGAKPLESGRVPVHGIDYSYEIHGQGEPLLLLHGGLGSIEMFGPLLTTLARSRQVIAVDLHGHGRTALGERPIEMSAMGDDLAALLKTLGYGPIDLLGYSMGADVALRLAIQHPESVRRSALVSPAFANDAYYPELMAMQAGVGAAMAVQMKETPMYKSYVSVAPRPEDFPRFLDAMGVLMRKPYDWSAEVAKLAGPIMLVFGDSDMIRPEHMVRFYQLLGGGLRDAGWMREHLSPNRLAILPNLTHYDILDAPELLPTVLPFLNGETMAKRKEGQ